MLSSVADIYNAYGLKTPTIDYEYEDTFSKKTVNFLKELGFVDINQKDNKIPYNPVFLLCLHDQLLKDGFKQTAFDKKLVIDKYVNRKSLLQKLREVVRPPPSYMQEHEHRFEETKAAETTYTLYSFIHDTYGTFEIKYGTEQTFYKRIDNTPRNSLMLRIDKSKYDVIRPYLENLFTTKRSGFIQCLYKKSGLVKVDIAKAKEQHKTLLSGVNKEILDKTMFKEIEDQRKSARVLSGIFTISDYDTYNEVFQDIKYRSTCPICLATQPKDPHACRYTYHKCNPIDLKHPNQKRLFEIFNKDGQITWCSACNRICKNHGHFNHAKIADILNGTTVPTLKPGETNVFSVDCYPYGGGALEKIIRYESLLRESVEIQKLGSGITLEDAKQRLVYAFWDAPYLIRDKLTIDYLVKKRQFTVSRNYFSIPGTEVQPAPSEKDITRSAEDADLLPIKIEPPNNTCVIEVGVHDDNRVTWKFKHRKVDGTVFEHPNDHNMCADDFMTALIGTMHDTTGACPIDITVCDAKIHPDEIKHILGEEDPRYKLYEAFYKERVQAGGADTDKIVESVFPNGPAFQSDCPLPPKKAAGKKKTEKSKGKKRRITYRKKNKNIK